MQVQRLLRGEVQKVAGFNMGRARDLYQEYKVSLSIVASWRISDISNKINIVDPKAVLGKADKDNLHLDMNRMAEMRVL